MKKILILGATGRTGLHLTQIALDRGYEVTILVRNPNKVIFNSKNLKTIKGDVLNYEDVSKSCKNQDAVLSALGKDRKKIEVLTEGTKNIIQAMKQNKVNHFICMSSTGAGSSKKSFGLIFHIMLLIIGLKRSFVAKEIQEKMLYESGISFSLILAGTLTNKNITDISKLNSIESKYLKSKFSISPGKLSRIQVAMFMLEELERLHWKNKSVCIYQT